MKEKDEHLIERYLGGDMTNEERRDMENRLHNEPDLRQGLMQYEMAINSLRLVQREELKARFRDRDKMLDKDLKVVKTGITRGDKWVLAVAALVIVLLAINFLMPREEATYQSHVNPVDTIAKDPKPVSKIDTAKILVVPEQKPDMAENKVDRKTKTKKERGEELYAANFEAYRDESLSPIVRSNEDETPLDKFRKQYWEQDFTSAISTFSTLSVSLQNTDNLRFIYAQSLAATKDYEAALVILEEIVGRGKTIYLTDAHWYAGLLNFKLGNNEAAIEHFQAVIETPGNYEKKAEEIIRFIKNP